MNAKLEQNSPKKDGEIVLREFVMKKIPYKFCFLPLESILKIACKLYFWFSEFDADSKSAIRLIFK